MLKKDWTICCCESFETASKGQGPIKAVFGPLSQYIDNDIIDGRSVDTCKNIDCIVFQWKEGYLSIVIVIVLHCKNENDHILLR